MKKHIIIAITGLSVILMSVYGFQYGTAESVTVTIKDKERILDHDQSKYLVFTDSEVFENSDAMMHGKFSSSDLYGNLEVGKTYRIRVYGWRIPFFSMYRNIIRIED